jgi:hypothetical protein
MIGLMVLLFFAIYLAITIWITRATVNWAKRNNRSQWCWGGLTAFAMYSLVFWDFIPTLIAHKYYCATEAGFWVYKTPEQWQQENPSLTAGELRPLGKSEMLWDFPYKQLPNDPKKNVLMINERIYLDSAYERNIAGVIPIHKFTSFIADSHDESRLAQLVTFGSGYGNPMTTGGLMGFKFWLATSTCNGLTNMGERSPDYTSFIKKIIRLGEPK